MKCLLDMDGVLVDFVAGAAKHHGFDPVVVDRWDFVEKVGLTTAQFWNPLNADFWAGLPWTPDGREILAAVEDAFGKENVCLLSSPCDTAGCMDGKLTWIREHLPGYRRRFLFGPAKEFAANGNRVLVDDSDGNAEAFRNAGGPVLLVPRPWNRLAGQDALEEVRRWLNFLK